MKRKLNDLKNEKIRLDDRVLEEFRTQKHANDENAESKSKSDLTISSLCQARIV